METEREKELGARLAEAYSHIDSGGASLLSTRRLQDRIDRALGRMTKDELNRDVNLKIQWLNSWATSNQ